MENETLIDLLLDDTDSAPAPASLQTYLPELADFEASEEEKLELLGVLFSIMRACVDLGFDVGAIDIWGSISEGEDDEESGPLSSDTTEHTREGERSGA
jgi:hypothetical protein